MATLRAQGTGKRRPAWTAVIRDGEAWLEQQAPAPSAEMQLGPLNVKLMASAAGEGFELRLAELVAWARDLQGDIRLRVFFGEQGIEIELEGDAEEPACAMCLNCSAGAIIVPEEGAMGDSFCTTIAEARAGEPWTYIEGSGWLCPSCARD